MSRFSLSPEPVRLRHGHHGAHLHHSPAAPVQASASAPPSTRVANVEALILQVQRQFPEAQIRVTGRGRTVRRQAELMAARRRQDRRQFLRTYRPAPHITEMDNWVTAHPLATEAETVTAFEGIIDRARRNGAVVSNHLSDRARDISIPLGGPHVEEEVRRFLRSLGAHVIDERDAVGGPHWHVDF